jgi:hypothetical protein
MHQRTPTSNSSPSGISRGNSAIIHRTVRCTPDMSGAPRKSGLRNSPASGIHFSSSAIIHRTVRCTPNCPVYTGLSGVTAGQRLILAPTATCVALNARQRAQRSDTPMLAHRTLNNTCPVRHRTSRRAQKSELQRSEPNDFGDVVVAPDCPVCTGLSGAPSNRQPHQTASLVVGAINTPNHPPFIASKFSTSQLLTRALAFNSRHTKEIKSSPNSTQRPSD